MVPDLVLGRGPHDRHPVVLPPQQRRQGIKTPLKVKKQKIEEREGTGHGPVRVRVLGIASP